MPFNEHDYIKATHASYGDDPTEWNGTNPKCEISDCENEIEPMDEYCCDHQRCDFCGEREGCDCEEITKQTSSCCGAKMDEDTQMCYHCKDHTTSEWDDWQYEQKRIIKLNK